MFKQILVPTDLSPNAEHATKKAVQIAHQFNSKITILNVHEEFIDKNEMEMLRVSVTDIQNKFRKIAVEAKSEIKASLTKMEANDINTEIILREGTPYKEILKFAIESKVDLIVMGTKRDEGLMDYLLGSTTENVTKHAKCPVLIVPN